MSTPGSVQPSVLVVDDERGVADTYALQLQDSYHVSVAYGGQEALTEIDEDTDAVLLDRRMPGVHGDDVLAEIRETGYDCKVIMATAVDPDLDILALDFDDYLCKPITRETLLETLDQQLAPDRGQDPRLEEFFRLVSKVEVLEDQFPHDRLGDDDEYRELKAEADRLGQELAAELSDFDEVVATFREINRGAD